MADDTIISSVCGGARADGPNGCGAMRIRNDMQTKKTLLRLEHWSWGNNVST